MKLPSLSQVITAIGMVGSESTAFGVLFDEVKGLFTPEEQVDLQQKYDESKARAEAQFQAGEDLHD